MCKNVAVNQFGMNGDFVQANDMSIGRVRSTDLAFLKDLTMPVDFTPVPILFPLGCPR